MAIVRLECMRALREAIVAAVPKLEGKILVGQGSPNQDSPWPHLCIDAGRLRYEPDQAAEGFEPSADTLVVNVGRFEGPLLLKLGAKTLGERYQLEQELLDLFLGQELRPGVLVTPVLTCPELGEFVAAWMLDDAEWQDELAFDRVFMSQVTVTATIPALVTRHSTFRLTDLRLGLADLGVTATPATFGTVADVVRVNDDGTITPL